MQEKKQIRKEKLAERKLLPVNLKKKYSQKISSMLIESKEFSDAEVILCYVSTANEVATDQLMKTAWEQKKRVGVPKVLGPHEMEFYEIHDTSQLRPGYKGILEPCTETLLTEDEALVVVPGAVFDERGMRIGYGGGFYDTYLKKHPGYYKAAFAFSMQMTKTVPTEEHDVCMDVIYTENRAYKRKNHRSAEKNEL